MDTTNLAQIIGPTIAAAAIGFFLHPKFYKKIMDDFKKHQGLTYFAGIFIMIIGIAVILKHNIWELNAAGLITLFAWGAAIKGATFLIIPDFLFGISNAIITNKRLMQFSMVIMFVAGAYLSYFGYFM